VFVGFIYPIITHWAWDVEGGGWLTTLFDVRFKDFAGSAVVHLHGGVSALIGTYLIGPRIGRFTSSVYCENELKGHSVPVG
jgi:Amt family ammonium transporter